MYLYIRTFTYIYTYTERDGEHGTSAIFFSPLSLFTYTERDGERVQWSAKKEKEFVEHKERKRVDK